MSKTFSSTGKQPPKSTTITTGSEEEKTGDILPSVTQIGDIPSGDKPEDKPGVTPDPTEGKPDDTSSTEEAFPPPPSIHLTTPEKVFERPDPTEDKPGVTTPSTGLSRTGSKEEKSGHTGDQPPKSTTITTGSEEEKTGDTPPTTAPSTGLSGTGKEEEKSIGSISTKTVKEKSVESKSKSSDEPASSELSTTKESKETDPTKVSPNPLVTETPKKEVGLIQNPTTN